MSLIALAQRIVQYGDRDALCELHENRWVFRSQSGEYIQMVRFLLELMGSDLTSRWCGHDLAVVEDAYDLTVAKFHDVPPDVDDGSSGDVSDGPDCRFYYRAFHEHITRSFEQRPPASTIDAEIRAADALQRLVTRNWYFSCLECSRRAAKLVRRYTWKVNGDQLVVWLPVEMSGRRCRRWLQENVPDPDPARPGERDRVQTIIDRLLARRRILSLDQLGEEDVGVGAKSSAGPLTLAEEISSVGLADVVAEEKAENVETQRPSIRALGGPAVKRLVETVFESLAGDGYRADTIATTFGLSQATFSRFAGYRWTRDGDAPDKEDIPDLWRNTAHILASHEDFVTVARQAGVWGRVRQIVAANGRKGEAK